jgi:hypothetical protein
VPEQCQREVRAINRGAGAALAMGAYSLYCAGALGLSPTELLNFPQFEWLFDYVPRWAFAVGHLLLAGALFLAVKKVHRILIALVVSTLASLFWAALTILPQMFGAISTGSTMGLGSYAFASIYSAYWAREVYLVHRRGKT